jgi:hypothetical protein
MTTQVKQITGTTFTLKIKVEKMLVAEHRVARWYRYVV